VGQDRHAAAADAERLVGQALDAGINFIDTADVYAGGVSEQITGQALRNLKVARDKVVVATKVFGETGTGPNMRGATRSHILDGVKASLKRLQLDHIDLYQIHGFDPATPIEETVRALDQLVRHGHVRYIGVSNWAAWQIVKALGISERLGLARFESLQAYYTVAGRDLEREIVPMLQSEGLGLMVWSPLAGGLLSGKYGREQQGEAGSRRTRLRLPAGEQGARLGRASTRCADREAQRRERGAGRAGLAAAPAAGDQRDRRRRGEARAVAAERAGERAEQRRPEHHAEEGDGQRAAGGDARHARRRLPRHLGQVHAVPADRRGAEHQQHASTTMPASPGCNSAVATATAPSAPASSASMRRAPSQRSDT
jgi:aryl-alcohol dehydrogenase-like predicted oxidoreductase